MDRFLQLIWLIGLRIWASAKRAGLIGGIEPILLRLAPRLVPPSQDPSTVNLPWARLEVPGKFPAVRTLRVGLYEPEVMALFVKHARRGAVVLDLGANVGYYSLCAARSVGPDGLVFGFEPDPTNYEYLTKNIRINGLTNVRALHAAVGPHHATMNFVQDRYRAEGHLARNGDGRGLAIEVVSIDDFFRDLGWPKVDLIKMDIEGGELGALRGMRQLCDANPAIVLIMEYNPVATKRAGARREDLAEALAELGFRRSHVIERAADLESGVLLPKSHAVHNLLLTKS